MKYKSFMLLVFLALPAVAAAPRTLVSTCDVQMQIRDGRDAEGLAIPGAKQIKLMLTPEVATQEKE